MSAVAENVQTEMPAPLVFTDSAAAKVADLIAEEGNPELKLRVFVQGGGCSGFQYGFTFDEITNDDDTVMSKNGVSLLIDAMSYQYLVGAEIELPEVEGEAGLVAVDLEEQLRLLRHRRADSISADDGDLLARSHVSRPFAVPWGPSRRARDGRGP